MTKSVTYGCVCLVLALVCCSAAAVPYRIVSCGALDGAIMSMNGGLSVGWGINNQGQVVGASNDARGHQYGVIWDMASGLRQMTLPGGARPISGAYAINNNGVAILDAQQLWNGPNVSIGFQPSGLNDSLQLVGQFAVNGAGHAVMWEINNGITDIGLPDGAWSSWAEGINSKGQVLVEAISSPVGYHSYAWDKEHGMRDLGMLDGCEQSVSIDINDNGEVVGCDSQLAKRPMEHGQLHLGRNPRNAYA
jgi:uncharacterized membrane protein